MALKIPGFEPLFSGGREPFLPTAPTVMRQASIIVAQDGTGDTDDLQEAINMLPSDGGSIFVKYGTYNITTAVDINKNNVSIIGSGISAIFSTTGNHSIFSVTSQTGIFISNLKFSGSGVGNNSNYGININGTNTITIEQCHFTLCGAAAIKARNLTRKLRIDGCYMTSNKSYGIEINNTPNATIINNYVYSNTGVGIYNTGQGTYCTFTNNFLDGNSGGMALDDADRAIVSANVFKDNTYYGVQLTNTDSTIVANNVSYSNADGIILDSNSDHNSIIGNNCTSNSGTGILINNANCDENFIHGNFLNSNGTNLTDSGTGTTSSDNIST